MRALVLCVLAVCVLNVCVCDALEVESHALGHCEAGAHLAKGRALSNESVHSAIFLWSNDREVGTWQYERGGHASAELLTLFDVPGADAAALECVRVNYSATINLPGVFSGLLSLMGVNSDIPIHVDKVVCYGNDVLLEDADIDAPVVGRIKMRARHAMYNEVDLVSRAHTVLHLPWYALPFSSQASSALDHSLQEKFVALTKSLCKADGGALLRRIRPTPTNSSFGVIPAAPGTRVRRFPLVRSQSAPPQNLGRVGLRRVGRSASAL